MYKNQFLYICMVQMHWLNMKTRFIVIFLTLISYISSTSLYSQSGKLPPFRMVLQTGKVFRAQDLPFEKPIIIIYFSPECEDCHEFMTEMLEKYDDFLDASIAMITYLSVDAVKSYVAENDMEKYPNFYIGTEGNTLFVAKYYGIRTFPFVALYDKNGNLIKSYYSKQVNVNDLITRLKNL